MEAEGLCLSLQVMGIHFCCCRVHPEGHMESFGAGVVVVEVVCGGRFHVSREVWGTGVRVSTAEEAEAGR